MKFGLIANTRKETFWAKLPELLKWFHSSRIDLIISSRFCEQEGFESLNCGYPTAPEEELPEQCDMLLAIGGDGTILRAVQSVGGRETPILGINVGGLGFLTDIPLEKLTRKFEKILRGEYQIEKRLMLEALIEGDDLPLYALNEISIDKGNSVRVIQIETEIDGNFLNSYVADGLLVSTPTGSTGYSLSSGGPIVLPSTDVLIINPICPHSLTNRPVILPAGSNIRVVTRTEQPHFIVAADGRDVRHCATRTAMTIHKAPFAAHLVKPLNSNFFSLLHNKLNWGNDFRDKKRWSHDS